MAAKCNWKKRRGMLHNIKVWMTSGPHGYCEVWKQKTTWTMSCVGNFDRSTRSGDHFLKSGSGPELKKLGCAYAWKH